MHASGWLPPSLSPATASMRWSAGPKTLPGMWSMESRSSQPAPAGVFLARCGFVGKRCGPGDELYVACGTEAVLHRRELVSGRCAAEMRRRYAVLGVSPRRLLRRDVGGLGILLAGAHDRGGVGVGATGRTRW